MSSIRGLVLVFEKRWEQGTFERQLSRVEHVLMGAAGGYSVWGEGDGLTWDDRPAAEASYEPVSYLESLVSRVNNMKGGGVPMLTLWEQREERKRERSLSRRHRHFHLFVHLLPAAPI